MKEHTKKELLPELWKEKTADNGQFFYAYIIARIRPNVKRSRS